MAKILVIEDEPAIADTIQYALSAEGFSVSWALTAAAGLAEFERQAPDLIILDVGLPDENGFDLCKRIRARSELPIIFLTARASEIDRIVGLEIGGDDYVTKPFSPRELAARVKVILKRVGEHSSPGPAPSEVFKVDQERHEILYFGQKLDLSRYEFKLLETLIARPGWVFSREKLMTLIWDDPDSSMERTVDTHIKTIRARLRDVRPEIEAIITHRGVGYALKEDW